MFLFIDILQAALLQMGSVTEVVAQDGPLTKYRMADSCYIETYCYPTDSFLVVETVCAPVCSSRARVYSKENESVLHECLPDSTMLFPEAHINREGQLVWSDNGNLIFLDD